MSEAEIIKRLERLERENRRLKGLGLAALVLATALGGIYAARPVPQKIIAHEFDVIDASGTARAKMGVGPSGLSYVEAIGVKGQAASMIADPSSVTEVMLTNKKGIALANMTLDPLGGPRFELNDSEGATRALMNVEPSGRSGIAFFDEQADRGGRNQERLQMTASPSGSPTIHLSDTQGFSMMLGSGGTENAATGETERTSAASIIMSGKDQRVIWRAP